MFVLGLIISAILHCSLGCSFCFVQFVTLHYRCFSWLLLLLLLSCFVVPFELYHVVSEFAVVLALVAFCCSCSCCILFLLLLLMALLLLICWFRFMVLFCCMCSLDAILIDSSSFEVLLA